LRICLDIISGALAASVFIAKILKRRKTAVMAFNGGCGTKCNNTIFSSSAIFQKKLHLLCVGSVLMCTIIHSKNDS
jgi:hypothetical protein